LRGGNESDDDIASVTSATSIPEKAPPSVEEARMTKRQKEKLLDNDLVKSKPKVVAAVKQVFVAPVAVDGATAVGEVKQLTVKPTILKVGSALYNKDADKCKGPERQIMKKELVKVLTAFPADQGQRGEWWWSRLVRQRLMRIAQDRYGFELPDIGYPRRAKLRTVRCWRPSGMALRA